MYAEGNILARLCNQCCSGKAISVTYSERVFTAFGNQNAMRMRHIVICGLPPLYNIFPHYLINGTIVDNKLQNTKCVL